MALGRVTVGKASSFHRSGSGRGSPYLRPTVEGERLSETNDENEKSEASDENDKSEANDENDKNEMTRE